MVVMTMLAFVVNVGLFVKAKINLQNAVDAAAFSGAAVQARQLSNIAYLNWEMRNTFKEWMFKYYVLGQLGLSNTQYDAITSGQNTLNPSFASHGIKTNPMNFRQIPFWDKNNANYINTEFDQFNVPSVCIHFAGNHNICDIKGVPGVPRFASSGLMGLDQTAQSFIDTIASAKSTDCSKRSDLNFMAAMLWAYGLGNTGGTTGTIPENFQSIPEFAPQRPGAWVSAMELALRIRNLEAFMNTPPYESVTASSLGAIEQEDHPKNERTIKAFLSAFRNLGMEPEDRGGGSGMGETLKSTFELTEVAPNEPLLASELSTFLIPTDGGSMREGVRKKLYLDLIPMPVNYSTFFTTFVADTTGGDISDGAGGYIRSDARCAGTKTALPVPGYILGFYKNPDVLTYYTVKGSAKYVGLFYPFRDRAGIEIKAYASAKPFGGRVGPMLFTANNQSLEPRTGIMKSRAYISGLNPKVGSTTTYRPGNPIPTSSSNFWAQNSGDSVGGVPASSASSKFGIPNMVYDYLGNMGEHADGTDSISVLVQAGTDSEAYNNSNGNRYGLYDSEQFIALASNLAAYQGGQHLFTHQEIADAISLVRRPTKYDVLNYLVPHMQNDNDGFESPASLIPQDNFLSMYAPLYGPGTLYPEITSVTNIITEYIGSIETPIGEFMKALADVGNTIKGMTGSGSVNYNDAGNTIHISNGDDQQPECSFKLGSFITTCNLNRPPTPPDPGCVPSLAGRLYRFISVNGTDSDQEKCGFKPLPRLIQAGWEERAANDPSFKQLYRIEYSAPSFPNQGLMTAYQPGERKGALPGAVVPGPPGNKSGETMNAMRNYYSTKFISTGKLTKTGDDYVGSQIVTLSEKGDAINDDRTGSKQGDFLNYLNLADLQPEFGKTIH